MVVILYTYGFSGSYSISFSFSGYFYESAATYYTLVHFLKVAPMVVSSSNTLDDHNPYRWLRTWMSEMTDSQKKTNNYHDESLHDANSHRHIFLPTTIINLFLLPWATIYQRAPFLTLHCTKIRNMSYYLIGTQNSS